MPLKVTIASIASILCASVVAHADTPCSGVTCSGHGVCNYEKETPLCFCDEGYAAQGVECVPALAPPRRSMVTGREIVALAEREIGRNLMNVGRDRASYPYALHRYVPQGGLWCSDFASWIYRSAGVPLSGGYEGGWLVTNNNAMKRWFERRALWVDKESPEFRRFRPRPGDYVRVRTRTWGHSAIVTAVRGDTLHLIEGNAGNLVRATRYRRWRRHPKVGGFGIVTFPNARRRWRSTLPNEWLFRIRRR